MQHLLAQPEDAGASVDPLLSVRSGVEDVVEGVLVQLPQLGIAVVVLAVFAVAARAVGALVRRALSATTGRSESFVNVMSRLARAGTVFLGILFALVVAIPSVDLAAVIGGLGISSVAIGFAFKDILQNTLAGLLLLFRQPFAIGDQIEVAGWTGTVVEITIRETRLRTFDGQRILIPNSDVYSSSVRVQTAYAHIRTVIAVGVDYDADLSAAREVALDAVRAVEGVVADPAPEALYTQLGVSTVDFEVRYWCASRQHDIRTIKDRVVRAVTDALNAADIAMPADVVELDARRSFAEAVADARSGSRADGRPAVVPAPPGS